MNMQVVFIIAIMITAVAIINTREVNKKINTVNIDNQEQKTNYTENITKIPLIITQEAISSDTPLPSESDTLLNCHDSCISAGYIDGRGPFNSSSSCNFPEIPRSGVCCCLHGES